MSKNITIYTSTTCPSCVMVKRFLNTKGQPYEEVNVDEKPEARQEAINVSGGAMTIPVTVVRDEAKDQQEVMVGWNPGKLMAALAA